jgi:heptaprenyl diphosphate synthase
MEIAEFFSLLPPLIPDLDRVGRVIRRFALEGDGLLEQAVNYYLLEAPGGYARPALVLAAAYAGQTSISLQSVDEPVITAAGAVELLNVGTLYQDDVIDSDNLRRGVPSANTKWGDGPAVLAGDHLMFSAIALSLELGVDTARHVLDAAFALFRGEMRELEDRHWLAASEHSYLDSVSGKQAALTACACKLGALLSGLDTTSADALERYGYELGMAGQIIDDILDLTSTEEFLGKPIGSDLRAGIYTLPLIYALRESPALEELARHGIDSTTMHDAIDLVITSGAVDLARETARWHVDQATTALHTAPLNGQVVNVLCAFADEILTGACWRE